MRKSVRVDKNRLTRFQFESMQNIRKRVFEKPELEDSFRKDFEGTLKSEGIKVDDAFLEEVKREWHKQISLDIKTKVAATPEKYPLLSKVIEGKPIRIHVTVDEKTHKVKTKEVL